MNIPPPNGEDRFDEDKYQKCCKGTLANVALFASSNALMQPVVYLACTKCTENRKQHLLSLDEYSIVEVVKIKPLPVGVGVGGKISYKSVSL